MRAPGVPADWHLPHLGQFAAGGAALALRYRLAAGGLDSASSVRLAHVAAAHGVDLIDVFSGGAVPGASIPVGPGYQTGFAEQIRREAWVATAAVGLISTAEQAEHLLATGLADAVFLARAALRDPHWWQRAAHDLGVELAWAPQYERAAARAKY